MGHVFRSEEQQLAVDGLRRFLESKIEPLFAKDYRDKFVPREKMAEIMRQLAEFGLVSGMVSQGPGSRLADQHHAVRGSERLSRTPPDLRWISAAPQPRFDHLTSERT